MSDTQAGTRVSSRAARVGVWVAAVVVCLMVMMPGVSKVVDLDGRSLAGWAGRFERWGLPAALVPVVGVAEVGGGVLILIPPLAPAGGVVVAVTMLGATATHAFNDQMNRVAIPFIVALLALWVAWFRWRTRRAASKERAS